MFTSVQLNPWRKTQCMVSPSSRLDSGIFPNFDPFAWPSSAPARYRYNCLIIHICNWPQSKQHAQQSILTCTCQLFAFCHVTLVGHLGSWCGLWLPWLEPGVTAIGWSSFSTSFLQYCPLVNDIISWIVSKKERLWLIYYPGKLQVCALNFIWTISFKTHRSVNC